VTRVKICGLTNLEDALVAVGEGASALGFVFADSPRRITPAEARRIAQALPPFVTTVGVFVDEDAARVVETADFVGLGAIQLHGSEGREELAALRRWKVIKAFRPRSEAELEQLKEYAAASAFLLDSYSRERRGGTGEVFDWDLARRAKALGRPLILAGGLTPENVGEAIARVRPFAVDVSSGVEAEPGKKDPDKVARFMAAVRAA
jgi:phosphoribosylanthranilate isomerase